MEKVSIILLTKNRIDLLRKCLISLSKQTYKNYEIIVLDDFSHDGTEKMILEMSKNQSNIRFYQRGSSGLGYGRKMGVNAAKGEIIAFIDDDEEAHSDWLKKGLEELERQQADIVRGAVYYPDGKLFRHLRIDKMEYPTANIFYKKEVLESIDNFDERFEYGGEDIDVGLRALKKGYKLVLCKEAVTIHCFPPKSTVSRLGQMWNIGRFRTTNSVLLFKKHPEYRCKLVYHYFYNKRHITIIVIFISFIVSFLNLFTLNHPAIYSIALLASIVSYMKFQVAVDKNISKYPKRVILFPYFMFLDLIDTLAIVKGAIKYRFFML